MGPEANYKMYIYSNFDVIFAVQRARGNVKQFFTLMYCVLECLSRTAGLIQTYVIL